MHRHKGRNIAAEAGNFLDDARAEEGIRVLRHHENRLDFFIQFTIHQGELEFEFEVRDGAQSADDGLGVAALNVIHQQGIEGIGFGIGNVFDGLANQIHPFFKREHRLFGVVLGDGHNDVIEQFDGAFDDVQVAVGQGIKTAGINGGSHEADSNNCPRNDEQELTVRNRLPFGGLVVLWNCIVPAHPGFEPKNDAREADMEEIDRQRHEPGDLVQIDVVIPGQDGCEKGNHGIVRKRTIRFMLAQDLEGHKNRREFEGRAAE
jgi:hypothetical protein